MLIGAVKLTEVGSFYDFKSATFCCVLRWCREADPNVLCVGDMRHMMMMIMMIMIVVVVM